LVPFALNHEAQSLFSTVSFGIGIEPLSGPQKLLAIALPRTAGTGSKKHKGMLFNIFYGKWNNNSGNIVATINQQIDAIIRDLPAALPADRIQVRREIRRLRQAIDRKTGDLKLQARCDMLAQRLQASIAVRQARLACQPRLEFDPALPITAKKTELLAAIENHPVIIVAGETGSGKTTQLPKLCMAAGRGIDGCIGVTQPRRIAATSVSRRIAEELGEPLGQTVGYKIRFQDVVSAQTRIKLMTDGVLLAEAHHDPYLNQYDTLIVDEAHERSLNIDFILGILKKLLKKRRDLKVIITSATIDTEKFALAFDQAPVIRVSGRMYPVQTRYMVTADDDITHIELAGRAVDQLVQERKRGDILIFMPTEQDIRDTCELLKGRKLPATEIVPLFARLSAAEQQRVFHSGEHRKIIVATNVAETSITIPGINFVVDTGLARISQYTPRSRTTTLPVRPISQSSADQRQGRCGRMANGICIRLYEEEDYQNRPRYTAPEILRANLAEVILRMMALKLGNAEDFPFIDPPAPRSIQDGYQLLQELGAICAAGASRAQKYMLSAKGRLMAQLPVDPRLSCMLLESHQRGCMDDMTIVAAALSIQDPRERPALKQAEADQAQARFADPASDFLALLRIWHTYQAVARKRTSWAEVKKFCHDHFLSFRRMREWQDVYRQLLRVLADHDIRVQSKSKPPRQSGDMADSWYAAVHQSILSGFLSNIAFRKERQLFQAAHNRQAMIFPGSGVFKNPGPWIVAAEMVETSRLFARCVAVIDPKWLEVVGGQQCKFTWLDPHWERSRGQVTATEQVSLYGLIIDRRPRPYGPANPDQATQIFIRSALIDGDVRKPLPFMAHNQQLIATVEEMEDRLRRKDLRVDDQTLMTFYQNRLDRIYDMRSLQHRILKAGNDDFLRLKEEDLLIYQPSVEEMAQFPDHIPAGNHLIQCEYRFDPGKSEDGITAKVPAPMAESIDPTTFQWLVPGLFKEKINALIKGLPKEHRKKLVPISESAEIIAADMPREHQTNLANALTRFIRRRFNVDIPAVAWDETVLPDHLRMRIALTDANGKVIKSSREGAVLNISDIGYPLSSDFQIARQKWERSPIEAWDFADLPETIMLSGPGNRQWTAYPALENRSGTVALTVFSDAAQAKISHPRGVRTLFERQFHREIKFLRKNLQLSVAYDAAGRYFGGRKTLEEQLISRVLNDLLLKDFRTAEGFHAHVQKLEKEGLAGQGQTKRERVMAVITAYGDLRMQLHTLERACIGKPPALVFLEEMRALLNKLIPNTFIQLYDDDRLLRLVRYIQAIGLRAERGLIHPDKDRIKAGLIEPFERRLTQLAQELSPDCSPEKRQAVESLFWMLEEYKISVFAQEIKTAHPVSAQRLERQLKNIETIV
jgi:ATP-dependent helicase HrpA